MTFSKAQHICLRRDIDALFSTEGHALSVYPIKAVYRKVARNAEEPAVKVLVSVAKRHLHHAVSRNLTKRRIREAYRLQQSILNGALADGEGLHIAFIWLSDKTENYQRIEKSVVRLMKNIAEKCHSSLAY